MEDQIEYESFIKIGCVVLVLGGMIMGTFAARKHRERIRKLDEERRARIKAFKKLNAWFK